MAAGVELRVNPGLLIWARETIGETVSSVAKRIGVTEQIVREWEHGEKGITYSRLEALADFYHRPIAAFFLPEVPVQLTIPTDFRTPNRNTVKVSKELQLCIRHAQFVRNNYVEINPDFKKFKFSKTTLSDSPIEIAKRERERFDISFETQRGWHLDETFKNWTEILEQRGILVLQKSFTEELNGFSLMDGDKPPVIVINSQDVPARKVFSLFHEYCHLLLDTAGICKITASSTELHQSKSVETFCDKFAGEFLVPTKDFLVQPEVKAGNFPEDNDSPIRRLALRFKVSKQVIEDEWPKVQAIVLAEENRQPIIDTINRAKENYLEIVGSGKRELIKNDMPWNIPRTINYNLAFTKKDYKKSIIQPYYGKTRSPQGSLLSDATEDSAVEQDFIELLEKPRNEVTWWFRNGSQDGSYFAVPYVEHGQNHAFYVDFVVMMKDERIGLFDTKAGLTAQTAGPRAEGIARYIAEQNKKRKKLFGGIVLNDKGSWRFSDTEKYEYNPHDLKKWKFLNLG